MALIDADKVWRKNYTARDDKTEPERCFAKNFEFHEALEDGTLPYLEIIAVSLAIDAFQKLTFDRGFGLIKSYLDKLTQYLVTCLMQIKHYNGNQLVEIYRRKNLQGSDYGPIVTFNLKNSKGTKKNKDMN